MNALRPLVLALIPEIPDLAVAIAGMFKKYPQLTPEQIVTVLVAVVAQSNPAADSILAKFAADDIAHPPTQP
jgi:hypothetical protein